VHAAVKFDARVLKVVSSVVIFDLPLEDFVQGPGNQSMLASMVDPPFEVRSKQFGSRSWDQSFTML
jgi:hypothetical protein